MLKCSAQSYIDSREPQQGDRPTTMNVDQEEDDSIYDDFNEILQSEVHVDVERLRILARQGIPAQLRGKVWKFLLGVEQADRSKELTSKNERVDNYKQLEKSNPDIAKRIRGEVGRYQNRTRELAGQHFVDRFERVIIAYLNTNREVDYYPALITMSAPFIYGLDEECDAYFCFERLMQDIDEYYISNTITIEERMAGFMTLFRYSLPDLCTYFDDEEVDLNQWATSWLKHLLSKEMKFENLVRLWDFYFSIPDPLDLHPFVCLAILHHIHEKLEELEQSEIKATLQQLPWMNMQQILADASNLRHEAMEREMSQSELYCKSPSPSKQIDGGFSSTGMLYPESSGKVDPTGGQRGSQ